jgi:hypothetical protein
MESLCVTFALNLQCLTRTFLLLRGYSSALLIFFTRSLKASKATTFPWMP